LNVRHFNVMASKDPDSVMASKDPDSVMASKDPVRGSGLEGKNACLDDLSPSPPLRRRLGDDEASFRLGRCSGGGGLSLALHSSASSLQQYNRMSKGFECGTNFEDTHGGGVGWALSPSIPSGVGGYQPAFRANMSPHAIESALLQRVPGPGASEQAISKAAELTANELIKAFGKTIPLISALVTGTLRKQVAAVPVSFLQWVLVLVQQANEMPDLEDDHEETWTWDAVTIPITKPGAEPGAEPPTVDLTSPRRRRRLGSSTGRAPAGWQSRRQRPTARPRPRLRLTLTAALTWPRWRGGSAETAVTALARRRRPPRR
jgi:hypothetical protein